MAADAWVAFATKNVDKETTPRSFQNRILWHNHNNGMTKDPETW